MYTNCKQKNVKAFTKGYNMLAYGIAFAKKKAYIKEVHHDLE